MLVHIPSPLRSYTQNQSRVETYGSTVRELLSQLDAAYPGIRFRMIDEQDGIRKHIKIFAESEMVTSIDYGLDGVKTVHILCALSGG